jgi:PAS domain S-box-containing protein
MRETDWTKSELGPPETWPQSLKTAVRIVLTSRQPMFVWWGENLLNLYNDAYKSIVGGKHPEALGQPASVVWHEIWNEVGPRAAQTMSGDEGTYDEALLLIMERYGYQEETYYTFSYSPVPNDHGGTGGLICANTDDTRRIISERRISLLRDLATRTADARAIADVCKLSAESLSSNTKDLPFFLIYLVDADKKHVELAARGGIEDGHPAAPGSTRIDEATVWPFARAIDTHAVHVVEDLSHLGPLPKGAWPKPPSKVALVPIAPSGATGRAGVLVVGLNPYRALDDDYRGFLSMVAGQISASIANVQAYEQEKQRAEALAELDQAKTAFFSNISHEFRTPLTLMLGPTEDALASDGTLGGEGLRTVHRNGLRLLKLVNALLEFSRIEAGRAQASYEPTDLATLTRDLASSFRAAIERAGLAFVVDCRLSSEPVYVDRDMWEKIVLNLLSNALKFTFEGTISVTLTSHEDRVEFVVADTGTGIPESELAHLFERFHRVQGARSRTHEGSGIGLALVSELVRLHGGSVSVRSTVGTGTAFTVKIPFGSAHLPPERVGVRRAETSTGAYARASVEEALRWLPGVEEREVPSVPAIEAGVRIVLADDNADMREYVERLLQRRWQVEAYADGRAALEAIRKNRPALLLTDVMMPELDGFGLLRAIREDPTLRTLPVIILSARAGEESRVEGLEAGADDYLPKPFSARELIARVSTHLQIARLRENAEAERKRLDDLFAQAPVAIAVVHGPELRYVAANAQYRMSVGREELVGKTVREVFPEVGEHALVDSLDRARTTDETIRVQEMKIPIQRAGLARDAYFDYVAQPIHDVEGAQAGVMLVAVEVTEQVVARRRIEGLRAAAEDASRAKDEFLSTLSHELRTPLNAIVGWSTLLRDGSVPAERTPQAIETIERNARLQARLIEDLLDLSRIEQGKVVLNAGPVEMVRVVDAAIEAVRPACDAKGVLIQPLLDSPAPIVGDSDRLQQVVWNLLSNAMKFTPKGGLIQVALLQEDAHVELTVKDDGQGIDPDFLPHVFERFRQGDGSASRKMGGLGLGLAIVRSLVELHGGTVSAHSDGPGAGAEFTVRLPRALARTVPPRERSSRALPQPSPIDCPPAIEGLRILVVDDEAETRELLSFVLETCHARVQTATNADEAFARIREGVYDLLISDVGMPGGDGYSLLRRVRELAPAEAGHIAALALTAYARGEDRTRALRAGFDMHMPKPIDPGELLVVIERLVERRRDAAARSSSR